MARSETMSGTSIGGSVARVMDSDTGVPETWGTPEFRVKFLFCGGMTAGHTRGFLRQFPKQIPRWARCEFVFDPESTDYDWLVVYHDLPRDEVRFCREQLYCPKENTLLIVTEPSTITVFGRDYLRQFGCVLTFQEPWATNHPNPVFHHPGLMWYYGLSADRSVFTSWDQLAEAAIPEKRGLISTVCSTKRGRTTLHTERVAFTRRLQQDLPELEIYGHGIRPMFDKAEAIDPFRYHLAVENHVYRHHLTEKLPDVFLGYGVPFYHGAPNAADYFPRESFIPVDITNYRRARETIISHLRNHEYQDRLPYVIEARRRVLEEQNLFAIVARIIGEQEETVRGRTMGQVIRNRAALRLDNPVAGLRGLLEKAVVKSIHRFGGFRRTRRVVQ